MRQIKIEINDTLYKELEAATANEPGGTPRTWACDAVEAALAARRLPRVRPATSAPRMVETMMRSRAEVECRAAGPMAAADIPTMDDLDGLADIG